MTATPSLDAGFFAGLYAQNADPWHFEGSWYEARKRALVLSSLPQPRYATAFEPACGRGHLTEALAARCGCLVACDTADAAVAAARERVRGFPHVHIGQAWLPHQWPANERFDLIVLSEFLYYLDATALAMLLTSVRSSVRRGGTVVACHWRHPIPGCSLEGDALHARLQRELALPRLSHLDDADFCLTVWQDAKSPAQLERRRGA